MIHESLKKNILVWHFTLCSSIKIAGCFIGENGEMIDGERNAIMSYQQEQILKRIK